MLCLERLLTVRISRLLRLILVSRVHFSLSPSTETVSAAGYCTIRAFGAEQSLERRVVKLIDKQQHAFFLTQAGLCWLAVRLELIGTSIIFFACMAAVMKKLATPEGNEVFAGLAGLSISYALSVTQSLNWAVRTGSDFEANMVSVERVRQYTHLEQEAPHETEGDQHLDKDWPSKGIIEFIGVELRYRPGLPSVLKGLNISIPGQAKVGIVGRTGMWQLHQVWLPLKKNNRFYNRYSFCAFRNRCGQVNLDDSADASC
jgi:ABC-type multidrug transport system fused ATPase/permease subunit